VDWNAWEKEEDEVHFYAIEQVVALQVYVIFFINISCCLKERVAINQYGSTS
jgi:hypothetical protein